MRHADTPKPSFHQILRSSLLASSAEAVGPQPRRPARAANTDTVTNYHVTPWRMATQGCAILRTLWSSD